MNNADQPIYPFEGYVKNEDSLLGEERVMCIGVTKREMFAAMAMQGFLSAGRHHEDTLSHFAQVSVNMADALLSALSTSSNQVNK